MDDIFLMTAAVNQRELTAKVQHLANEQIAWARQHGAIFDVKKSKWLVLTQSEVEPDLTIAFGDRTLLKPENETRWLRVVLDSALSLKQHRNEVISKGTKRAHFLSSLSNAKWGI